MKQEIVQDMLCDLQDILNMSKLCQFGSLPKDNDGSQITISECLENCIDHLKEVEQ